MTLQERTQLLPSVAVSLGVLIAAFAYVREHLKKKEDMQRNTSAILFNQAEKGFDEVLKLLQEKPNDRIIWIRAARALLKAEALGAEIKSPEFCKAFTLLTERIRNDLYLLLTEADPKTGARKSLPPQYFYGIDDWKNVPSLDEAAIKASNRFEVYSVTIDNIPPEVGFKPLSEHSIIAIYNFIEYPSDYHDPLKSIKGWDSNWEDSNGAFAGPSRYIAHRKKKHAVDGKLYEREQKED